MGDVYHEIVPCGDVLLHLRQQTEDETMFKTITYRLSSSHLALASGYFKRMFSGDWKEKESLAYGKPMEINAQDWNPVALLILMNIIHGRTRVVPRKVQLPLLLDIATLVDYYKCLEAIEIVLEIWLDEPMIKSAQEKFLEPTTLTWAWAAYVFQRPILFRETTRLILLHSKNPLDPGQYPIPQLMIGT